MTFKNETYNIGENSFIVCKDEYDRYAYYENCEICLKENLKRKTLSWLAIYSSGENASHLKNVNICTKCIVKYDLNSNGEYERKKGLALMKIKELI